MREIKVSVKKLTGESLMREACECTFLGKSKQTLLSIYKSEHSPARTQLFWVKLVDVPLFISTELLRHHVGCVPFQLSCREDRNGGNNHFRELVECIQENCEAVRDSLSELNHAASKELLDETEEKLKWLKENADRQTPVTLGLCLNAQSLMDMAKLRLCRQAHPATRHVMERIREAVREADPSLAEMMVPKCVYRGGLCGEPKCCGWNNSPAYKTVAAEYTRHFQVPTPNK